MSVDILHMICEDPSKPLHSEIAMVTSLQKRTAAAQRARSFSSEAQNS
jgi:hypothetical protein